MSTPVFVWVTHPTGRKLVAPDNVILSKSGKLAVVRMNKRWKLTFVPLGLALGAYFNHFTDRRKATAFMRDLDKLWGGEPNIEQEYLSKQVIWSWNAVCRKHGLPFITRELLIGQNIHTDWKGR